MDIRNVNRNSTANLYEYDANNKDSLSKSDLNGKKAESGIKTDKIQISSESKQLNIIDFATNKIKADFNREVSAEKLNALKSQIKSGAYKADANLIAGAILTGTDV